jgi:hypothetical protein
MEKCDQAVMDFLAVTGWEVPTPLSRVYLAVFLFLSLFLCATIHFAFVY